MDPYPTLDVATGVAFACKQIQPSLRILLRELEDSFPNETPGSTVFDTELNHWQNQGVMLMNSALTCLEGKPGSHLTIWRKFILQFLETLTEERYNPFGYKPIIFVLLGRVAQSLDIAIDEEKHIVLKFPHPAAEAYQKDSFIGCGIFSKINEELKKLNIEEINWYG